MILVARLKVRSLPVIAGVSPATQRRSALARVDDIGRVALPHRVVAADFLGGLNRAPGDYRDLVGHPDVRIAGVVDKVAPAFPWGEEVQPFFDHTVGPLSRRQ